MRLVGPMMMLRRAVQASRATVKRLGDWVTRNAGPLDELKEWGGEFLREDLTE